jgi:hypothetical protein
LRGNALRNVVTDWLGSPSAAPSFLDWLFRLAKFAFQRLNPSAGSLEPIPHLFRAVVVEEKAKPDSD